MAIAGLDQSRSTEPGPKPNNKLNASSLFKEAERRDPIGLENGQTKGLSFEIIEEKALLKPRRCRDLLPIDDPFRIGHLDGSSANRSRRAGDERTRLYRQTGDNCREGRFEAGEIPGLEARCRSKGRIFRGQQGKPRICAADVTDENGKWKLHAPGLSWKL